MLFWRILSVTVVPWGLSSFVAGFGNALSDSQALRGAWCGFQPR